MMFTAPIQLGALARFDSKVVYTGKSKITVFIKLSIKMWMWSKGLSPS